MVWASTEWYGYQQVQSGMGIHRVVWVSTGTEWYGYPHTYCFIKGGDVKAFYSPNWSSQLVQIVKVHYRQHDGNRLTVAHINRYMLQITNLQWL